MKKTKIGVVGLGYVGLPISIAFSRKYKVIGYDINLDRINSLNKFIDSTLEVSKAALRKALKNNFEIYERVDTLACLKKK